MFKHSLKTIKMGTKKTLQESESDAPKVQKPRKGKKVSEIAPEVANMGMNPRYISPNLAGIDLLKAKLRKKFNLLKDESLNFDDRELLLDHVCVILGMNRPQLDNMIMDL
jgi:hypothetical protein